MTISRPYSSPKMVDEALAECVELNGLQFMPHAVQALLQLHAADELARKEAVPRTFASR